MPGRDRNPARHSFAAARGDPAAGRECWPWSTHSLQAAAENLATPWSPPSHHQGCFETLFSITSLKINEAVYFQGCHCWQLARPSAKKFSSTSCRQKITPLCRRQAVNWEGKLVNFQSLSGYHGACTHLQSFQLVGRTS